MFNKLPRSKKINLIVLLSYYPFSRFFVKKIYIHKFQVNNDYLLRFIMVDFEERYNIED